MAFDNTNKANVAFKNLQNKSHTDASKEIGAEADSIFFNIDSTTIFTDTIDPNPVTAITDGIALQVTAELVYDTSSNNQAWKAVWPNPLPAGAPDGVLPGDRVTNSISAAYGIPYEAKPYGVDDALISPGDPRDWIYQYQSGIFYQQTLVGPLPKEIIVYVYTGTYLNDALENTGSGDVSSINYAAANMDMQCDIATIGQKVTAKSVIEFPISDSLVKLNGVQINVGPTKDCYFSPDGIYIRPGASAAKGDYLYWNSDKYDLDAIDEVDFVYMVSNVQVIVGNGDTIVIEDNTQTQNLSFTGSLGETANVTLGSTTILVGNVAGNFVWDIGEIQEHTFTEPNTYIEVIYSSIEYVIWYDGAGSLLFSLKNIIPVLTDTELTSNTTVSFGDIACATGLGQKPYDITGVKIEVNSNPGVKLTTGVTEYNVQCGLLMTSTSTGIGGEYAFQGDKIPLPFTKCGGITQSKNNPNEILFTTHENIGYNTYNTVTNTNVYISAESTGPGQLNEVNGTPMPAIGLPSKILVHPNKNIIYILVDREIWEYNMDTNTGTIVVSTGNYIRGFNIDIDDDVLFAVGYGSDLVAFDITNRTTEVLLGPDSGDAFPTRHTSNVEVSPDRDLIGMAFAGSKVAYYIEKGTSTIGVRLDVITTASGGSHEVNGDPLPVNSVELMRWATNSAGDQIGVYSVYGYGIWLYNVNTNTGTFLSPTTTGLGGSNEVVGDPLVGVGIASIYVKDFGSTIYITTEGIGGLWIYDIDTNTGTRLDVANTSENGKYAMAVDPLPTDNLLFCYTLSDMYLDTENGRNDFYLGGTPGLYVIKYNGTSIYDYAWFEDNAGNIKSAYALGIGDKLHWNPGKAGFNLTGSELLDFKYYI